MNEPLTATVIERAAENAWLNRLADEWEQEGRADSVSSEEMVRELARGRGPDGLSP
ncbi:hypothetical protein ACWFMI_01285 [Nocardiopsis terrae]